jgi:hypothetical protein
VGSDRGSIVDSEDEKEEEVRTWYGQVMMGRKLRIYVTGWVCVTCLRVRELIS